MIDALEDNCLATIFSYLPIKDKLNVEIVCKRWKSVSQISWRNYHRIDPFAKEFTDVSNMLERIFLCKAAVQKYPDSITELKLACTGTFKKLDLMDFLGDGDIMQGEGQLDAFKDVFLSCRNIQHLKLCSCFINCNDQFLGEIFKNNNQIRTLELTNMDLKGACFALLRSEVLESLVLVCCHIEKLNTALFSISPKLSQVCLRNTLFLHPLNTLAFITPKLRELDLSYQAMFLINNPKVKLVADDFVLSVRSNVPIMRNLKVLRLSSSLAVDDEFVRLLGRYCINLRGLDLGFCYLVTDQGLKALSTLPKLKCLKIDGPSKRTNKGLENLNPNVKTLSAITTKYTHRGFLEALKKSKNLKKIILGGQDLTSALVNSLIRSIPKLKLNRTIELRLSVLSDFRKEIMRPENPGVRVTIQKCKDTYEELFGPIPAHLL
ncbi:hypothetical protein QAD02_024135 [Eretmocerus hayati]|uniref:Uncharacterized protein n=1 Tax=Eretmocerus hayati TaxID=131215 RepID=A0ACC2PY63_9HYME|nr:hypothetical protein QAD02_024135 [Eretmocerus hayati]